MHPEGPDRTVGGAGAALWPRALALALAVAACYANSLRVPFLMDDPRPDVRLDYSTRPLVWASFALNRWLSGSDTWSFHVFNALVHLACGFLLLGILRATLTRAAPGLAARTRDALAFVATLLWLCHPLQTAAVTYLSQRAETMGAFFYLLVLYAFLRSAASARPLAWQALACLALALGFATKEIIVTAPLLVLLYDAVFLAPGALAALRLRRGFYGAMALVTLALAHVLVVPLLLAEDTTVGPRLAAFGPLEYARTQAGVLLHYLRLVFWPHPLCFDYGWPIARDPRDYVPQSAAIVTLLFVALVLLARRSWIGFAGAWFFVILAPTSSFVPVKDPAFEHRMVLPLAGVLVLAVVGGWWLLARLPPRARLVRPVLAATLVLASAATTIRRNRDYRSAEELWRLTVERAPHNPRTHANLGAALLEERRLEEAIAELQEALRLDPEIGPPYANLGKAYLELKQVDRAIAFMKRALEFMEDPRVRADLGGALSLKGDHAGAAFHFEKAVEMNPGDASLHYRLACALGKLARTEEAQRRYEETLRLDPDYEEAHVSLAALLADQGRTSEALEHSRRALALPPTSAEELFGMAQSLQALGRFDEASAAFLEASRLAPELPEPYAGFAQTVCLKPGARPDEVQEALRQARKANELTYSRRPEFLAIQAKVEALAGEPLEEPRGPDLLGQDRLPKSDAGAFLRIQAAVEANPRDARLHHELAGALARLQRPGEAIRHYLEALRLDPDCQEAHIDVAALLCEQGRALEALEHSRHALAIPPNSAEEQFTLAQALRALGRFDEAMAAFLEAGRMAPDLPEPWAAFAKTVCLKPDASREEREEALRLAQKANEMSDSTRPDFLEICAMARAALGDFERALALVEEALKLPGPTRDPVFASRLRALREEYLRKAGR